MPYDLTYIYKLINYCNGLYSDPSFVFKSCQKEWIVILQKLNDAITNELRNHVANAQYAKFRGNQFLVIDIINKFDINKHIDEITNSYYRSNKINYKKGEIVKSNSFDEDLNNVCSNGIHYFKSIEPAFYYEVRELKNKNGIYTQWYENGQIELKCNYKDDQLDGEYTKW